MIATLTVQIEGWRRDHEDDWRTVLGPVYQMLDAAMADGVIADYRGEDHFPMGGEDIEDPRYAFTVGGLKDGAAFAELRRRAYTLAGSDGPNNIIDCEVE